MAKRPDTLETVRITLELLRRIPRNGKISGPDLLKQLQDAGFNRDIRTIERHLKSLSASDHFDIERDDRNKPFGYKWKERAKGLALPVSGAILFLLAVAGARYLGYVRSFGNLRQQLRETLERRRVREYFRARGRVLDCDVERSATIEDFGRSFLHAIDRMNVSLKPGADRVETRLDLSSGRMLVLHHPADDESSAEWRMRLDELVTSLEGCLARWHTLPDCLTGNLIEPESTATPGADDSRQTAAA